MKNEIKTKLQQKEFEALKGKPRVVLRWATGVGKSKMAIDLVNHVASNSKHKPVKILFVVAERAHIKNWQDEFEKWHLRFDKIATHVICYASLHKERGNDYDVIVFDEAHHAFTEKRMAILETMDAANIIMLSATLSLQKIEEMEDIFGKFIVSTISLKKAVATDLLPDPKVYLIEMELDNNNPNQYILIGNGSNLPEVKWEERAKYIYKNIPCRIICTAKQKYDYLSSSMEYWKQRYERSHNDFHRNRWVNLGSQRKRFLGELKTDYVRALVETLPEDKRFICFCTSVSQAEELNARNTISSKRSTNVNQGIIDSFNAKKLNKIFAIGMANEGLNLVDIHIGIIVQLDGKERLFIQKFGRSLRAEDPVTYVFYYKNTQDENYLKNALENIDSKFVKRISVNRKEIENIKEIHKPERRKVNHDNRH